MQLVTVLAVTTAFLGLCGGLGWVFEIDGLKNAWTGESTMKPNTAVGLLLTGASLWGVDTNRRRVAFGTAAVVLTIGLGSLVSLALDSTWFSEVLLSSGQRQQMSAGTASALTLLGLSLLATVARWRHVAQWAAAVALGIAGVAACGYTLGLQSLGRSTFWSTMALHTSLGVTAAACALVYLNREGPLTRMLLGEGIASAMGRRLVAFSIVVPWLAAFSFVQFGGEAARASALAVAQTVVPLIVVLVAGLLRFTSTVARSELDLRITLDSIGDGVLLTDAAGRLVRLNPVAERLTGWSTDAARGRPVDEVFHIINQDSRAKVESPVTRVLREGVVVGLANHTNLIDRSGIERPIADSGAPVRAGDGSMQGVVLVFRDVSEQYATQRALERSESTLTAVMNAVPTGLVATHQGTITWANAATSRMLGLAPGEEVGKPLRDFLPLEDEHLTAPRRTRIIKSSGDVLVDLVPVSREVALGEQTAQLTLLESVADATALEHRIARQAQLQRATSELSRKLADASFDLSQILEQTARLSVIAASDYCVVMRFEPSPDGLKVTSRAVAARTDELVGFARRFESFTAGGFAKRAYSGEAMVLPGSTLRAAIPPEHQSLIAGIPLGSVLLQPMRAEGVTLGMLTITRTTEQPFDEDERAFYQDLADRSAQALRNAQLFETTTTTLATLKTTEEQLRHSQKLEAVGQLAGGIAHDFNNLLSVILTLVELLLQGRPGADPERADLEDIKSAAMRAAGLTKQLLSFSRKQVMQLRPLELNEVVRSAERLLRPLLGEDVRLELSLSDSAGVVRGDLNLLTQVLMNLGVNARDAMPRGGQLTFSTGPAKTPRPADLPDADYSCITVSDEGSGISAQTMAHLFEPFFTTKGPGRGTGLGLSTSYGIVRQTGGTITVSSKENVGSSFVVWLPQFRGGPRAATPPPTLDGRPRSGKVLLVEDEPAVREVAARLLRAAGYDVTTAAGVTEGLAAAAQLGAFDLLVTDVVMPDGSGRDLADALLERHLGLKVLFMSGYTEDAVVQRGVTAGTVRLLQKPFTQHTLLAAVGAALT